MRRRRAVSLAGLVLVLAALAALWWLNGAGPERSNVALLQAVPRGAGLPSAAAPAGFSSSGPSERFLPPAKDALDPVGGAFDLKRVFDDHIASGDPRRRGIAVRAFDACVPAFLPAGAQTPSPEPLIRALPADHRAEREAAYWSLFARCQGFLGEGRASLERLHRQLQGDQEAQEPGLRAQEDLLAGRTEGVDAMVSQALAASDPAAVASLAGLAARLALLRNPDAPDADLAQRARAVDAALPLVACDLGLDCSATSLPALQLCAVQGSCEGDLASRMGLRSADSADASEIQQQRARLLALIRSGRVLTTVDLLP